MVILGPKSGDYLTEVEVPLGREGCRGQVSPSPMASPEAERKKTTSGSSPPLAPPPHPRRYSTSAFH